MCLLTYLDDRTESRSLQTTSVFMSAETRLSIIWKDVGDSSVGDSSSPYQKLSHSQTFFLLLGHILCSFTVSLRRDTQSLNASLMCLAPCWT